MSAFCPMAAGERLSQVRTRTAAATAYFFRSPTLRAQRAKLKSQRDDKTIAPGKRSAARGCGHKMISSFFLPGWRVAQGGGLGGLALGYYQAAPLGLRTGQPGAPNRRPWGASLHA